jgi:hypothetical protein
VYSEFSANWKPRGPEMNDYCPQSTLNALQMYRFENGDSERHELKDFA